MGRSCSALVCTNRSSTPHAPVRPTAPLSRAKRPSRAPFSRSASRSESTSSASWGGKSAPKRAPESQEAPAPVSRKRKPASRESRRSRNPARARSLSPRRRPPKKSRQTPPPRRSLLPPFLSCPPYLPTPPRRRHGPEPPRPSRPHTCRYEPRATLRTRTCGPSRGWFTGRAVPSPPPPRGPTHAGVRAGGELGCLRVRVMRGAVLGGAGEGTRIAVGGGGLWWW